MPKASTKQMSQTNSNDLEWRCGKYVLFQDDCFVALKNIPDNSIDLTITSPPYCMGKEYETTNDIEDFIEMHKLLLPEILRITKIGGSVCWQVGHHVEGKNVVVPLDCVVYGIFSTSKELYLRNRIVWTYEHGLHCSTRFSGRHETVLWFTKGEKYHFNLDAVRVPQKYPGKKYYKGDKKGRLSGNPLGKNPSDVWSIPNVKANHIEKSSHPCQFPVALAQRLVRALTQESETIFDPFMGSGSSGVAALIESRRFIGAEIMPDYFEIAERRCAEAVRGCAAYRPIDRPIFVPTQNLAVAKKPDHFA